MNELIKRTDSKYQVLVVCNDGDYFLRHRSYLARYLSAVGVDVTVIAGGHPIPEDRIQGWKYINIFLERFRFDPISDFGLFVRTARTIRLLNADAVHLITLKPAIFSGIASIVSHFFRGYPKRVLITLPGLGRMMSQFKSSGERSYPIGRTLTLMAMRLLASRDVVHFSFETNYDRDYWAKWGIANNTNSSVLDGAGVDLEFFYPPQNARRNSKLKAIFASRLLKSKGLTAFLMAARNLADRSDVEFLVAGLVDDQDPDGVRHEYLQQLSEIQFLGQVDDMPTLLRGCDIVCLPTRYGEGIPRILIEAAATGLPSIVSSHPGCREIVQDGVSGRILTATSDVEMSREMSAAIVKYIEDPDYLRQHKNAAYQHFRSREFNQDACSAKFAELLGVSVGHEAMTGEPGSSVMSA